MPVNCSVYVKYAKKIRPTLRMLNLSTSCVYAQGVHRVNCSLPTGCRCCCSQCSLPSLRFPTLRMRNALARNDAYAALPWQIGKCAAKTSTLGQLPPLLIPSPTLQRCAKCELTSKKNKKRSIKNHAKDSIEKATTITKKKQL